MKVLKAIRAITRNTGKARRGMAWHGGAWQGIGPTKVSKPGLGIREK